MRRSGNEDENKRIAMDLGVLLECGDCPHIVKCYGYFIGDVEVSICMELLTTCFDKLLKKLQGPIPEPILGKVTVAVCNFLDSLNTGTFFTFCNVKQFDLSLFLFRLSRRFII